MELLHKINILVIDGHKFSSVIDCEVLGVRLSVSTINMSSNKAITSIPNEQILLGKHVQFVSQRLTISCFKSDLHRVTIVRVMPNFPLGHC